MNDLPGSGVVSVNGRAKNFAKNLAKNQAKNQAETMNRNRRQRVTSAMRQRAIR